jgi:hypothetical protein
VALLAFACSAPGVSQSAAPTTAHAASRPRVRLSTEDKEQLEDVTELLDALGNEVWPGFGDAPLALIVYADKTEFLVGATDPPAPWTEVADDNFGESTYHWRPAEVPQSFAVAIGEQWAGSIEALSNMSRRLTEQARDRLPPGLAGVVRPRLTRAEHGIYLCHETFHALQATTAVKRFRRAVATYPAEQDYPYHDRSFAKAWNQEGRLLAEALDATEEEDRSEVIGLFLAVRRSRRHSAGLADALVEFERELEWLEGLAKYVEMELCKAASRDSRQYRPVLSRAMGDFRNRLVRLGTLPGQQRFYLSGAAQAVLLDRIDPRWEEKILKRDTPLEQLLEHARAR